MNVAISGGTAGDIGGVIIVLLAMWFIFHFSYRGRNKK